MVFDGGGDPVPAAEVDVNGDGFLDYARRYRSIKPLRWCAR